MKTCEFESRPGHTVYRPRYASGLLVQAEYARMAKLVNVAVSEAVGLILESSSLSSGTILIVNGE